MFTKNDVLDLMKQDLKEMKENVRVSEVKIEQFLSRFEDLDKFFNDARDIVKYYFENQSEFRKIEDFNIYLKEKIKFYINSFSLTFEEREKIDEELSFIGNTYDKLIYLWIKNPVENKRKEEEKLQPETDWIIWTVKWYFWKIIK